MLIAGSNMLSMKTITVGIHWCPVIPHTLRHWNATCQGTIWMMTKIFVNTRRTGGSYRAQNIYNISENSSTLTTNGVGSTCMIQFLCCVRLPLKWTGEEFPVPWCYGTHRDSFWNIGSGEDIENHVDDRSISDKQVENSPNPKFPSPDTFNLLWWGKNCIIDNHS